MRFHHNLIFIVLIFLSGCNSISNDVSAQGIPTSTLFQPQPNASNPTGLTAAPTSIPLATEIPPSTATTVVALNPLTGLPQADPSKLNRRPLAIKIANYPRYMRPQSGLSLADQVFEYYIEDGLTRFIAVFYGNDSEWVGPVRSGRYFDEHIQRMYHAFLVFKFADPRELDHFRGSDFAPYLVVPTNGSCPPFRLLPEREQTVEVYNNSYFNTYLWEEDCVLRASVDNNRPYIRFGLFSDQSPSSTLAGYKITTYYSVDSYHYWLYSPADGQYYRYQEISDTRDGKAESYSPVVDRVTNQHVHASNVVVMLAYHTFENPYDQDDEVYQIDLTGSGEAYVFRDGIGIPAKWYRTDPEQPLLFATLDGAPINMKPGITFYEVIGARSFADQTDGEWNFHHDPP